jgi:hypothetical protein
MDTAPVVAVSATPAVATIAGVQLRRAFGSAAATI